ncbi:DUF5694 domain-containing protein [Chryseobacterium sp. 09-1422]|uniref:DUF5694 domain-containing protein n=1 Tax=Chryseobacterium kimseyorum TaxID=2984028 RepID=A0ABT3HZR3_9FLAO|nr:DUF5694 domain-containing protein [Chryseobacterium kimseyorum]MCW3169289.1 DUF5694 domain-containing protein [Chryseobacterium kimseyorum]
MNFNKLLIPLLLLLAAKIFAQKTPYDKLTIYKTKFDDAVPVLNVATFHMGQTPDANSTEFNEHDLKNQLEIKEVAKLLAEFKPTIIVIEDLPQNDSLRNMYYQEYVKNPKLKFENPDERELLAYEVGRLSGSKKIFGIDFKENYNYKIGYFVPNKMDKNTNDAYWKLSAENDRKNPEDGIPFYDLFKLNNHPQYLESLINLNADMLTYVSTKGKSEGADEAAKFYHRNLVMFSNLNQIPIDKNDRIFILMGGAHTAFFMDFLKRSPKYKVENIFDYLK